MLLVYGGVCINPSGRSKSLLSVSAKTAIDFVNVFRREKIGEPEHGKFSEAAARRLLARAYKVEKLVCGVFTFTLSSSFTMPSKGMLISYEWVLICVYS